MTDQVSVKINKGGRPKKDIRRDLQLAVMCTIAERVQIESRAKEVNISISEYLRNLALKGHVDRKIKTLPKEVLLMTAMLNHLAANMNQVAKKRNQNDELNALERANLSVLSNDIKKLAIEIKSFLK